MEGDVPNFDICLDTDSDDGLFLTQQPSQARRDADLNQSIDEIDLENLLNNTKDSAFDGDSSFEKILSMQYYDRNSKPSAEIFEPRRSVYRPEVEDSSCDEQ